MIWLTWQQHRLMVFVGGLVLVLLIPFLIITGLVVIQASHAAIACPPPDTIYICRSGFAVLVRTLPVLPTLSSLPLLVGAFIGTPPRPQVHHRTRRKREQEQLNIERHAGIQLLLFEQ